MVTTGNDVEDLPIRLEMTCSACPEQYDAFMGDTQVGYLRLRHGYFRVDFPECGGETIYEADTSGDGYFDDAERDYHLGRAKAAILARLSRQEVEEEREHDA